MNNKQYLLINFSNYVNDDVDYILASDNLEALKTERNKLAHEHEEEFKEYKDAEDSDTRQLADPNVFIVLIDMKNEEVIHGNYTFESYHEVVEANLDMIEDFE